MGKWRIISVQTSSGGLDIPSDRFKKGYGLSRSVLAAIRRRSVVR